MEEIIKNLEEIVNDQLEVAKKKKKIPSEATLSIVRLIMTYHSL